MGNLVTHQFTDTSVIHSELCHLQNWGHNYGLCVTQWRMAYPSYPIPLISPWLMVPGSQLCVVHRIGLWENFNRKVLCLMVKTHGFPVDFPNKPIQ